MRSDGPAAGDGGITRTMGKGILGPLISQDLLPGGGGKTLDIRDAGKVGAACEVHHLTPEQLATAMLPLISRPGGVDVCRACTGKVLAWRDAREAERRRRP